MSDLFRSVRWYKGEEIPWQVHDCDEDEDCSFCLLVKREFVKLKKSQPRKESEPCSIATATPILTETAQSTEPSNAAPTSNPQSAADFEKFKADMKARYAPSCIDFDNGFLLHLWNAAITSQTNP